MVLEGALARARSSAWTRPSEIFSDIVTDAMKYTFMHDRMIWWSALVTAVGRRTAPASLGVEPAGSVDHTTLSSNKLAFVPSFFAAPGMPFAARLPAASVAPQKERTPMRMSVTPRSFSIPPMGRMVSGEVENGRRRPSWS